ncbi:MAG: hypothetical protein AAF192_09070 [Pseudomonadota bacterium]
MRRRIVGAAAVLSLLIAPLAQAAVGMADMRAGRVAAEAPFADPMLPAAAEAARIAPPATAPAALAGGIEVAKKRGGGGARAGGARGGAKVRKGGNTRYKKGGNFKSGNTVVVNRGRPGYVYHDDDNDLGSALVGGVIGLGIGAAIANSGSSNNTCVDNNGDGVCDAY